MRVAVVGGRGFIGRHVVAQLQAGGHEANVIGRGEPLAGAACVVHLALWSEADARAAVARLRGQSGRLVAISSGDVYRAYGQLLGSEPYAGERVGALDEDAPLRSRLYPYGRVARSPAGEIRDYDKILVERVVLDERALPATILRLPKVYGPGDRQRTFWAWLERMRAGQPVVVGRAQGRWRWTHGYVENVAAAIVLAALAEQARGRIYNLGEAATPTVLERVQALARAAGWSGRVETVPDAEVPPELGGGGRYAPDLVLDSGRIRAELGYAEPVPEEEALERFTRSA